LHRLRLVSTLAGGGADRRSVGLTNVALWEGTQALWGIVPFVASGASPPAEDADGVPQS